MGKVQKNILREQLKSVFDKQVMSN
jgi:hypothetical protein